MTAPTVCPGWARQQWRTPTVRRIDGFRVVFYSLERLAPPHIHGACGEKLTKYWLEPVQFARSRWFRTGQLTRLRAMVMRHRERLLAAWRERFDGQT
ncbi:MAG TPA: DUF4160 domain-containing protein [Acetobacteraceae bacterium]|nr:DUF4160 domain-containing protein [Acetobacteraceae bacterium]